MSVKNERYTIEDLISDYGEREANASLSSVRNHYDKEGVNLSNPAAMARTWLEHAKTGRPITPDENRKPMFDTMSCKSISSMLYAMGRMPREEINELPDALFEEKAWIKGETVVIDWDVPGVTREQIARIEQCLGMKLIIKGISIEEELPF